MTYGVQNKVGREFSENGDCENEPDIEITESGGKSRRGYYYGTEHEHSNKRKKIPSRDDPLKRSGKRGNFRKVLAAFAVKIRMQNRGYKQYYRDGQEQKVNDFFHPVRDRSSLDDRKSAVFNKNDFYQKYWAYFLKSC